MFVVVGEALVDVEPDGTARPGGSPYNVAVGLARLQRPVGFGGRLSGDRYGRVLRAHALASGVDLSWCVAASEPTTTARVSLRDGIAEYEFTVDGTADFAWTDAELARLPTAELVHFGSLTSWLPPGDAAVARRMSAYRDAGAAVSYDPNVRPHLQPDAAHARAQVERSVELAHVVKASADDLAYLYPGGPAGAVARGWLARGPSVVVVTGGADGPTAYTGTGQVHRSARRVDVVDTVGAGDAFTSGLLDALADRQLIGPAALAALDPESLAAILDHAGHVAALTCARAGADPPRRAEL